MNDNVSLQELDELQKDLALKSFLESYNTTLTALQNKVIKLREIELQYLNEINLLHEDYKELNQLDSLIKRFGGDQDSFKYRFEPRLIDGGDKSDADQEFIANRRSLEGVKGKVVSAIQDAGIFMKPKDIDTVIRKKFGIKFTYSAVTNSLTRLCEDKILRKDSKLKNGYGLPEWFDESGYPKKEYSR